ncbi:DNA gyrase/topoisomerase IV subunit A [Tepidibacter formicigenes]|jgi:DNA gyrase subunit A|uniref:DNA gyrase subunit A n=1 Tax=Tepidibacter formicigenes DSM 15518 TaxID=1123349 RepID=A0A1M6MJN3_9FIRM|nr:DNA topoisomerase (ATP-hydrolyzing) subunit A [Tepidibacter formicigenes]SHJ83570.1 DNA gyrase subunit A [Tepidibacter formicigenes DSM 15518]
MTNNVYRQKITETLEENYMPYAMSVIVSRAIPEIDGLKPSHRKLLYTMYKMGLLKGNKTKSANVVGQTMKLNPHGDMAIYATLVRLTRGNETLLHPFVDSKGNFGKKYSKDMSYAAPRYTEVKLDKICDELFKDIDKNTVEFIDNYDGTLKEPTLLPTTFPNILVNANQGIAVGMANSMCSFNLKEVCDTAINYIRNENVDIAKYLKAPDLSSGGYLIYEKDQINKIYETGKGSFKLRAKYNYDKKNNCIEIYEIPYTTNIETIIDKIVDLVKNNKIREIADIRDETDLNGLKVTLDLKRNTNVDLLMKKLFKLTPLEDKFTCNFNILINGSPRVLGIKGILKEWVTFRINCIKGRLSYDIDKKSDKLHLLLGLKKILLDIDKAIKIIKDTEEDKNVIPNLMKGFNIDNIQAEFIAEIKLRNLNKEYIINQIEKIDNLKKELKELKDIIEDDKKIKNIIINELKEVSKKHGKPRRTEIISEEHIEEINEEHLIENYNVKLFLTNENYLKKISLASLRAYSDQKLKDDDFIIQELEANNKEELLLFSNKRNLYKLKIYEINDCKASSLGEYLINVLGLDKDEKIIYIVLSNNYEGYMIYCFENGKISKVELSNYETKTNRKKLVKAYSGKSKLVRMFYIKDDVDITVFKNNKKALFLNTKDIDIQSTKTSQGVEVLRLGKKSKITDIKIVDELN